MRIYNYSFSYGDDTRCSTVTMKLSDVNDNEMTRIRNLAARGEEIKIEIDTGDWLTSLLIPYAKNDIERTKEMFKTRFADIKVEKVIFNKPATIVFWSDNTKTVVVCGKDDTYDKEKGFFIACAKKLFGNDFKAVGRMNKALAMAEDKNG